MFDCEGARPSAEERAFFREANPWGFILFARHCETPEAVKAAVGDLREAVGRAAPILIDQEGGRVARMKPPSFRAHLPAAVFGALWKLDRDKARAAAQLNAYLLGRMVSDLGVDFDCAPALDVPQKDATDAIGDRALAVHQDIVADLGRAVIDGLLEGGAIPVMKHMPGHGRAIVDTHNDLARTSADKRDLRTVDFAPFHALSSCPAGMTAHVVYEAYDDAAPGTLSPTVIREVIRGEIGFDGLLFSDDLKMNALGGPLGARAGAAVAAGCDIALCCHFPFADKIAAAEAVPLLAGDSLVRAGRALAARKIVERADTAPAYERLAALVRPVAPALA